MKQNNNRPVDKRNDDSTDNILTGLAIAGCAFLLVLFILAFFTGCGVSYAPVASESTETVGTHTIDPDTEAAEAELTKDVLAKIEAGQMEKQARERAKKEFKYATAKKYWQAYIDGKWYGEDIEAEYDGDTYSVYIIDRLIYVGDSVYGDVNTPVGTPLSSVVYTGAMSYTQKDGVINGYSFGSNVFEFADQGYIVLPELQVHGGSYSAYILGVTKDNQGEIETLAAMDVILGEWQVLAENLEEYEFSEDGMTLTYRDADTGLWQFNLNDVTAKPVKIE